MADRRLWALLLLAFLIGLGILSSELGNVQGDGARYILLAQSLATGHGYRSIYDPNAPFHVFCPFGFPVLLTPVVALWGVHAYWVMHLWILLWAMACLALWYRWVKAEAPPEVALLSVGCVVASPLWIYFYQEILAEFPYLAFSLMALLCFRRYEKQPQSALEQPPPVACWCVALSALAAYFIRTIGITLVLAMASWFAWEVWKPERRGFAVRRLLFFVGIVVPPILSWCVWGCYWSGRVPEPAYPHLFRLADFSRPELGPVTPSILVLRVVRNALLCVPTLGELFVYPATLCGKSPAFFIGGVCFLLVAAGWLRRLSSGSLAEKYILFYGIVLLLWQKPDPPRFLLPILPWLWLYFLEGGRMVFHPLARLGLIVLLTANLAGCMWILGLRAVGASYPPSFRGFIQAHEWIRRHSPPKAVILSHFYPATALLSDRKAVGIPYAANTEKVLSVLHETRVTYVVDDELSPQTQWYLVPAIRKHLDLFEPEILRFGQTVVLKVKDRPDGK